MDVIPDDAYADGGEPYTQMEARHMANAESFVAWLFRNPEATWGQILLVGDRVLAYGGELPVDGASTALNRLAMAVRLVDAEIGKSMKLEQAGLVYQLAKLAFGAAPHADFYTDEVLYSSPWAQPVATPEEFTAIVVAFCLEHGERTIGPFDDEPGGKEQIAAGVTTVPEFAFWLRTELSFYIATMLELGIPIEVLRDHADTICCDNQRVVPFFHQMLDAHRA